MARGREGAWLARLRKPAPPTTKMEPEQSRKFVRLPILYDSWPQLKGDLSLLASEDIRGIVAFEEVLQRNDRWAKIQLPMTLLRGALKATVEDGGVCTLEHFSSILMPWIAKTALQVEQLFKDCGYKLQVTSQSTFSHFSLAGHMHPCTWCRVKK